MDTCIFKDPFSLRFFLSLRGGNWPGRNGSTQTVGAEERKKRGEGCTGFLGKAGPREERFQFRGLGVGGGGRVSARWWPASLAGPISSLSWERLLTALQLSQSSNIGFNVTLQNSVHLSDPEYTS